MLQALIAGKPVEIDLGYPAASARRLRLTPTATGNGLHCFTAEKLTCQRETEIAENMAIREEADRLQKLMQAVLDSTDAILYSVDLDGRITAFNKAASQAVKTRKGRPIQLGDYWPDMVGGDSGMATAHLETLLAQVLSGEGQKTIQDLVGRNGEVVTYSVQAGPVVDTNGKTIGAVLCAHDITLLTRLQREAAEKAMQRTLELENWNKFHDMLLSVLTHDLRHPLSVIMMNADLVKHTGKLMPEEKLKSMLGRLRNTCSKSVDLLEGLLHWVKSKREDFSYRPKPLAVAGLLVEANGLFADDQEKKGVILDIAVPDEHVVYAHQEMTLFICRNLINNATKYAPPDSNISVRSVLTGNELTISFKDNGKGMSAEELEGLFSISKPFATTRDDIKGAGMALAVARDMVSQMSGRIWAESEPGKGTAFHITLPVEQPTN